MTTQEILKQAKASVIPLRAMTSETVDAALRAMAEALIYDTDAILAANADDMAAAKGKIKDSMLDRLFLTKERIAGMADGILQVAALPSPLGRILSETRRPNGLLIRKVSVPLGVLAIIYESRPNVTSDAAALAIKSGNAVILRSGKEAHRSATAIVKALKKGLVSKGLPEGALSLIEDTSRQSAEELMTARGYVDLLIPRGGAGLIKACVDNATVPCLETGTGICHIYVDGEADLEKAITILDNAKTSRPSVCNAAEVCLVHRGIAERFLPMMYERLVTARKRDGLVPVLMLGDEAVCKVIPAESAKEGDFVREFSDYILAVKIVDSAEDAVSHIASHSTGHSEAVITENSDIAALFMQSVDSAAVYHNASTRFTDGGEFGLGCEMGISTQKLHARGPLGLCELTSYRYFIFGSGQVR